MGKIGAGATHVTTDKAEVTKVGEKVVDSSTIEKGLMMGKMEA